MPIDLKMFKLTIFQIFTFIGLILGGVSNLDTTQILYWSDLGIIEQVRVISGLIFMVIVGISAFIIFRSVWVKNGYAGLDKVLVDKEVGLFMSHVLAFVLLEVFFFMILFYDYVTPPSYIFWICGAGFLSPEAVQVLHFMVEKFKTVKKTE